MSPPQDGLQDRIAVEAEVRRLLCEGGFAAASAVVAKFEAGQPAARGIGVDWRNHDPSRDVLVLGTIFREVPGILRGIEEDAIAYLRLAAGQVYLWGVSKPRRAWLPRDLPTGLHLDADTAARMFVFLGEHRAQVAELDSREMRGFTLAIRTSPTPDSCSQCQNLARARFSRRDVPELPHPSCTHRMGCRCTLSVEILR